MTTDIQIDEAVALDKLTQVAKAEQAIERAFQPIADSLMVSGKKGVEQYIQSLKDDIKGFLMDATEPFLFDGELQWGAKLQHRAGQATYDLVTAAQTTTGPDAIIEAAKAGYLRVDDKMLSRFRKESGATWADELWRYRMPGTGSIALLIGPEK